MGDRVGAPGVELVGGGAGFVLVLAGIEVGLLAQSQCLHWGGFAAMISLELCRQRTEAGGDGPVP